MRLCFGFLFGLPLIFLEIAPFTGIEFFQHHTPLQSALGIAMIVISELCLFLMLLRFEELDTIQQLEREVKELEETTKQVEEQNEKMNEFWNSAQELTELWLYRTVPRLDLYKEVHSQLEDAESEDLLANLRQANSALENLESTIGAIEDWRNDGCITSDDKKHFGKMVAEAFREHDMNDLCGKLEEVVQNELQSLKALPAPSKAGAAGA